MGAHFARKGNQMAGYFIASYDVSNADTYAKYNPGSLEVIMGTVAKQGGKLLVATDQATWIAGERTGTADLITNHSRPPVRGASGSKNESLANAGHLR